MIYIAVNALPQGQVSKDKAPSSGSERLPRQEQGVSQHILPLSRQPPSFLQKGNPKRPKPQTNIKTELTLAESKVVLM